MVSSKGRTPSKGHVFAATIRAENTYLFVIELSEASSSMTSGNTLLDDFDEALGQRGLRFARYAEDFPVCVRTPEAVARVYRSVEQYLTRRLKLVVNQLKSGICSTNGVEFLGYQFHGFGVQIRVSARNVVKFKRRVQEITRRNRSVSMSERLRELGRYGRGWMGCVGLEHRKMTFRHLDRWLRRRVRSCYWKSWRLAKTEPWGRLRVDAL